MRMVLRLFMQILLSIRIQPRMRCSMLQRMLRFHLSLDVREHERDVLPLRVVRVLHVGLRFVTHSPCSNSERAPYNLKRCKIQIVL